MRMFFENVLEGISVLAVVRISSYFFQADKMQLLTVLLASAAMVNAHYNFNAAIYGGVTQPTWQQGTYFSLTTPNIS